MKTEIKWTCTDPSTQQYGRKLGPNRFEFKEMAWDGWFKSEILMTDYTQTELENYIAPYYGSLKNLWEQMNENQDEFDWILAECIFENELTNF